MILSAHPPLPPPRVMCSVLVFFLFLAFVSPVQAGETITFDGTNPGMLQIGPIWAVPNSLFPGTRVNPGLSSNTVKVTGGTVGGNVYGGIALSATPGMAVNGNTVAVSDTAQVSGSVFGGYSDSGSAWGNTATASGNARVNVEIVGGYSDSGSAWGNTAMLSGSATVTSVIGGRSPEGEVYNNTAIVSGGVVDTAGSVVFGGYSHNGNAHNNTATINGDALVLGDAIGGHSINGNAYNNTVAISGDARVNDLTLGGHSINGDVYGNSVNISGRSVGGTVYGGYSDFGNAYNNTVSISGIAQVNGNITGGLSGSGDATNNSVILSGEPVLNPATNIQGGRSGSGGDVFSGNSLTVLNPISSPAALIGNFENYRFMLPATAGGGAMLTATDINLTDGASRTATVDRLGFHRSAAPAVGDSYTLLSSTNAITGAYNANRLAAMKGISLLYDVDVVQDTPNTLTATVVSGARGNPQTKALSEGRISELAFVKQGADLAAGPGMASLLASTRTGGMGEAGHDANGLAGFGVMSGGTSRYNTGSHSDVDGFSLMTGLGWRAPLVRNSLLLGVFFEAGWGNYDSHNSFSNAASVRGKGDMEYYGGGILARYGLTEGSLAGLYTEASLRAGHTSLDFSSRDLQDFSGPVNASYDSGSAYYGAHAGLGYIWNLTDKASLDFSTKYLWTRLNGDSVTVAGDPIRFKAENSHRWRNGARFNYSVDMESGMQLTPYIGAAYDHEFDGKARSTAYGINLPAPDLKGGTGIGELGVSFKPAKNSGFALDLGMQGYVGVREGVSGSFQLKYEF